MIKTVLSVGFFLCVGLSYGQEKQATKKPVKQIRVDQKTPVLTKEMEQYAIANGSYIAAIATGEDKAIQYDGEVTLETAQKIDPKVMGINIIDRNQFFKISGQERVLIVKSTWVLDNELKTKRK